MGRLLPFRPTVPLTPARPTGLCCVSAVSCADRWAIPVIHTRALTPCVCLWRAGPQSQLQRLHDNRAARIGRARNGANRGIPLVQRAGRSRAALWGHSRGSYPSPFPRQRANNPNQANPHHRCVVRAPPHGASLPLRRSGRVVGPWSTAGLRWIRLWSQRGESRLRAWGIAHRRITGDGKLHHRVGSEAITPIQGKTTPIFLGSLSATRSIVEFEVLGAGVGVWCS
jgi:hypothetical protein